MRMKHGAVISMIVVGFGLCAALAFLIFGTYPTEPQLIVEPPTTGSASSSPQEEPAPPMEIVEVIEPKLYDYIEVIQACGPYWSGEEGCVNVRSGPGTEYPVLTQLRTGVVLKVSEKVTVEERDWYKVVFDEWLRYPERVTGDWYVAAEFVRHFEDVGTLEFVDGERPSSTKLMVVDRSAQLLSAYDGFDLFATTTVSTGLLATPTPRGQFYVYRKTPSRYMQGPLPGVNMKYYDLPGVPWNLYFTYEGAVVHGAYWHDHFGQVWSSGCVNLTTSEAKKFYDWADLGTSVVVRD
jgi:hypothetical protein